MIGTKQYTRENIQSCNSSSDTGSYDVTLISLEKDVTCAWETGTELTVVPAALVIMDQTVLSFATKQPTTHAMTQETRSATITITQHEGAMPTVCQKMVSTLATRRLEIEYVETEQLENCASNVLRITILKGNVTSSANQNQRDSTVATKESKSAYANGMVQSVIGATSIISEQIVPSFVTRPPQVTRVIIQERGSVILIIILQGGVTHTVVKRQELTPATTPPGKRYVRVSGEVSTVWTVFRTTTRRVNVMCGVNQIQLRNTRALIRERSFV
jgi:hypothetical protein